MHIDSLASIKTFIEGYIGMNDDVIGPGNILDLENDWRRVYIRKG